MGLLHEHLRSENPSPQCASMTCLQPTFSPPARVTPSAANSLLSPGISLQGARGTGFCIRGAAAHDRRGLCRLAKLLPVVWGFRCCHTC